MNLNTKFTLIISLLFLQQSCINLDTPEDYFTRTTLHINSFQSFGLDDFKAMKAAKENNAMHTIKDGKLVLTASYEQFFKTGILLNLTRGISKVKALKPTNDTKEMIDLSLDLLNFVKEVYETDYIKITQMLDANTENDVINEAITKLEKEKGSTLVVKMNNLLDVALPYAKKHNINVTVKN